MGGGGGGCCCCCLKIENCPVGFEMGLDWDLDDTFLAC